MGSERNSTRNDGSRMNDTTRTETARGKVFTVSCICCKKPLEEIYPDVSFNQPLYALTFKTRGHYGSQVFDAMDGTYLELNVCDECVRAAVADRLVYINRHPYQPRELNICEGADL